MSAGDPINAALADLTVLYAAPTPDPNVSVLAVEVNGVEATLITDGPRYIDGGQVRPAGPDAAHGLHLYEGPPDDPAVLAHVPAVAADHAADFTPAIAATRLVQTGTVAETDQQADDEALRVHMVGQQHNGVVMTRAMVDDWLDNGNEPGATTPAALWTGPVGSEAAPQP